MKKSRFTESQIVSILKEADAGRKVADICRKHGISEATYYHLKSRYSGLSISELKRMKEMEAELSQFKRMYANLLPFGEAYSRARLQSPARGHEETAHGNQRQSFYATEPGPTDRMHEGQEIKNEIASSPTERPNFV